MQFYEYLWNYSEQHATSIQCKLCSQEIFWRQTTGGALGKRCFSSFWLVGGHLLTARARAGDYGFSISRAGSGRLLMLKLLLMEPIGIWQKRGEQYYAKTWRRFPVMQRMQMISWHSGQPVQCKAWTLCKIICIIPKLCNIEMMNYVHF